METTKNESKPRGSERRTQLLLPSDREIVVTRTFGAPKRLLFEVLSKPEHVRQWYGCEALAMTECIMDFREGGAFRWVLRDAGGLEHAFSGTYREIVRPDRLVFTERYEAVPGSEHLVTNTLEERERATLLTVHMLYPSADARDGHLKAGMEVGLEATYDRLEAVVAGLRARS